LVRNSPDDDVTEEQLRLLIERENPTAEIARLILERRREDGNEVAVADGNTSAPAD
jgi:hypothetical protein